MPGRGPTPEPAAPRSITTYRREGDDIYAVPKIVEEGWRGIDQLIAQSPNPEESAAKVQSSIWLGRMLGRTPADVFRNFEATTQEYWGILNPPLDARQAIEREFRIAELSVLRGRIGLQLMMRPNDPNLLQQLRQVEDAMPMPDDQRRGFFTRVGMGVARFAPFIAETTRGAKTAGAFGAATGAAAAASMGATGGGLVGVAPGIAKMLGLGATAMSIPGGQLIGGLALAGYGIGQAIGSATSYMELASGNVYLDSLNMVSDDGQKIPRHIAVASALTAGALSAMLAPAKVARLTGGSQWLGKLVPDAIKSAWARHTVSPVGRSAIARFSGRYLASGIEGVVEELYQESMERLGTEAAAMIAERVQGTSYADRFDREQWINLWLDTADTTGHAQVLMAIPGAAGGTMAGRRADQAARQRREAAKVDFEDRIATIYAETTEELRQKATGLKGELDSAVERFNRSGAARDYQNVMTLIEQMSDLESEMAVQREVTTEGDQKAWQVTREEWSSIREDIPQNTILESEYALQVKDRIREQMPLLTAQQADGALLILNMAADAQGLPLQQYVESAFVEGVFLTDQQKQMIEADPSKKAGVDWLDDGRAMIIATSRSDFSSWVHELGHVFRRQLSGEMMAVAARWVNDQAGSDLVTLAEEGWQWTRDGEEVFAVAFEQYLTEGVTTAPIEVQSVFRMFSRWLRQIYRTAVLGDWEMNNDIRRVYESIFRREAREEGAAPSLDKAGTLHQSNAFHGTGYQFQKFSTEHIGAGEGAQAFGWGLYFSESHGVAKSYAERISSQIAPEGGAVVVDGVSVSLADLRSAAAINVYKRTYQMLVGDMKELSFHLSRAMDLQSRSRSDRSDYASNVAEAANDLSIAIRDEIGGAIFRREMSQERARAAAEAQDALAASEAESDSHDLQTFINHFGKVANALDKIYEAAEAAAASLRGTGASKVPALADAVDALSIPTADAPRVIYEVVLNPGRINDVWLDWYGTVELASPEFVRAAAEIQSYLDGRLAEATVPEVKRSIQGIKRGVMRWYNQAVEAESLGQSLPQNKDFYRGMADLIGDREASQALDRAGYDGISYPVGTLSGDWSSEKRNFVVFNEDKVQIKDTKLFQTAYHGTDRAFTKFSSDKIGSGLGKQVSGWGLYFLGPHGVNIARDYAHRVASTKAMRPFVLNGNELSFGSPEISREVSQILYRRNNGEDFARPQLAREVLTEQISRLEQIIEQQAPLMEIAARQNPAALVNMEIRRAEMQQGVADMQQALEGITDDSEIRLLGQRVVYEVDLFPGQEPHFVMFKEPLLPHEIEAIADGLEGRNLRAAAEGVRKRAGSASLGTAERIYRDILERELGGDQAASLFLADVGVDGFVVPSGYHMEDGSGIPIYVVFDEEAVTIRDSALFQSKLSPAAERIINLASEQVEPIVLDPKAEDLDARKAAAVQRAARMMHDEISADYRLNRESATKAERWYDELEEAIQVLQEEMPVLADPSYRTIFTALIGVSSNGQKMDPNFWNAAALFRYWMRTGTFPVMSVANPRSATQGTMILGISENMRPSAALGARVNTAILHLEKLDRVIQRYGVEGAAEWLLSEHSGRDIARALDSIDQDSGREKALSGLPLGSNFFGMEMIGPKLGQFAMAFSGQAPKAVKDVWFTRTWNRYMGTPYQSYSTDLQKVLKAKKAEQQLALLAEVPRNDMERAVMEEAIVRAAAQLSETLGRPISKHQMQALLWYHEKMNHFDLGRVELKGPMDVTVRRARMLQEAGLYNVLGLDEVQVGGHDEQVAAMSELAAIVPVERRFLTERANDMLEEYGERFFREEYSLMFQSASPLDGQISFEARPGSSLGQRWGWMNYLTYSEQSELLRAVDNKIAEAGMYDRVAERFGLRLKDRAMLPGVWMDERNPSMQISVDTTEGMPSAENLNAFAAIIGRLTMQDGMGWHIPNLDPGGSNVSVALGRELMVDDVTAIAEIAEARYGDDVAVISSTDGVRLLNFTEMDGETFAYQIADMLEELGYDESATVDVFAAEGNLISNDWGENPDGQAYSEIAAAAGEIGRDSLQWADSVLAPQVARAYSEFAQRYEGEADRRRQALEREGSVHFQSTGDVARATAFWVHGDSVRAVEQTHIRDILDNPNTFGLTRDAVLEAYKAHGEKIGFEGKAREAVIRRVIDDQWIRVRHYKPGQQRGYWSLTVRNAERQADQISNFLLFALEKGRMHINSQIQVQSLDSNTVEAFNGVKDYFESAMDGLNQSTNYDEHYIATEDAVYRGEWVPADVLREYTSQDWAADEISRREALARESLEYDNFQDFVSFMAAMDPGFGTEEYYRNIFQMGHDSVDSATANQHFVRGMTKDLMNAFLVDAGNEGVLPAKWEKSYLRAKADKQITEPQYEMLLKDLKDDPSAFREVANQVAGENAEVMRTILENAVAVEQAKEIGYLQQEVQLLLARDEGLKDNIDNLKLQVEELKHRIHAHEEALQSARDEAGMVKAAESENTRAAHDALRSAREESMKQLMRDRQSLRDRQKVLGLQQKLVRRIMKKPSGAINHEQASQIREIQSRFETRPGKRLQQLQQQILETARQSGDEAVIARAERQMNKEFLSRMDVDQLVDIYSQVEGLRHEGRRERAAFLAAEREYVDDQRAAIVKEVAGISRDDYQLARFRGSRESVRKRKKPLSTAYLSTLRPERLWRHLDGDKRGPVYNLLWTEVNRAEDESLRRINQRIKDGSDQMDQLGVGARDLSRQISFDGHTYTVDQALSMYIAMQNRNTREALIYGNKISEAHVKGFVDQLTNEQRAWGDWMIDSFDGDSYERLAQAVLEDYNAGMEKVQRYFPLWRQELGHDPINLEVAAEMQSRSNYTRAYVGSGFRHKRLNINERHQTPMKLGATNVWKDAVVKQEKYAGSARLVKRLHRVFSDRMVRDAITERYGHETNEIILGYINAFTNPQFYKTSDTMSRVSRTLRNNAAISYLAFNAITMMKQAPSVGLFLADAGPSHLFGSIGTFMANPRDAIAFVNERDPQMESRSLMRLTEELMHSDRTAVERMTKRVGGAGMAGIAAIDRTVVTIGWRAVYERMKQQGASEQEAIREAQTVVLRTQPAARAKDLAAIYRGPEAFNWFLMFTNQLNQIWNIVGYDIPVAVKHGEIGYALAMATGVAMSGIAIGMINELRAPEDPREAGEMVLQQLVSAVPFLGGNIKSGMEGWFGTGVDPVPVAHTSGRVIRAFKEDMDAERKAAAIAKLIEDTLVMSGIPTVQPRRMHDVFFGERWFGDPRVDWWEALGGRAE